MAFAGCKFGVIADFVQFDVKKWTTVQKAAVVKALKDSAKEWLAIISARVPRDSGFLMSGFQNLAAALGVSLTTTGTKRGRDAYGQNVKLESLEKRYRDLRQLAVVREWLEPKFRKGKQKGYKRNISKPLTSEQMKARLLKFGLGVNTQVPKQNLAGTKGGSRRKFKPKLKKKKTGTQESDKQVGNLIQEGLTIQGTIGDNTARSAKLYRREQNVAFYNREREKKQAARLFKKLSNLRNKVKQSKKLYLRAEEREGPLKQKKRPKYYRWEKVEISKDVTVQKEVEVPNPAYPTTLRAISQAKAKGALPPKTLKQVQNVTEKRTKIVKRRVKAGSEKDFVNIYRKYYYPQNGVRGPLKTPQSGVGYGTPADKIFQLETTSGRSQSIASETSTVNKGGSEIPGKEEVSKAFTPDSSLRSLGGVREANLKISFEYGVDIRYWKVMDTIGRATRHGKLIKYKGAPWGALTRANIAFRKNFKARLEASIISFTPYCVKTTSKFAPGFTSGGR